MNPALQSFLWGGGCFLAFAGLCLPVLRLPGRLAPVTRQAGLSLLVHVLGVAWAVHYGPILPYFHGAALYWFLVAAWSFVFSAVYKSVSLGVLCELARLPQGELPLEEITRRHVAPRFAERIDLLVAGGLVRREGEGYLITDQGRRAARRLEGLRRLFGVAGSGLYGG